MRAGTVSLVGADTYECDMTRSKPSGRRRGGSKPAAEKTDTPPTRLRALRARDGPSPAAETTRCPTYRPWYSFAAPAVAAADRVAACATTGLPALVSSPPASPRTAEPASPPLRMTIDPTSPLLHAACRELMITASPCSSPPRSASPKNELITTRTPTPHGNTLPLKDGAVLIRDDAVLLRPAQRPRAVSSDAADAPRPLRPQPPRTKAPQGAGLASGGGWAMSQLSQLSARPKSPERVTVALRPALAVFRLPDPGASSPAAPR